MDASTLGRHIRRDTELPVEVLQELGMDHTAAGRRWSDLFPSERGHLHELYPDAIGKVSRGTLRDAKIGDTILFNRGHDLHVGTVDSIDTTLRDVITFTVHGYADTYQIDKGAAIAIAEQPIPATVNALIDVVQQAVDREKTGLLHPDDARRAVLAAGELLARLHLRAYPMRWASTPDETAEQVHITVHGVDVMVRGREHDLYVDVTDERDDEQRERMPLTVAVDDVELA